MPPGSYILDFEKPLQELERQIEDLERLGTERQIDVSEEARLLQTRLEGLRAEIYANLTPIQRVQVARHPRRPYTLDYMSTIFTDFIELHGDRLFRDDPAIVGGWARLAGLSVMVIGHQKGRDTKENLRRNFGMAHPEGYRKALRLMKLAAKFGAPVITLIDTPGAYPGLGAEERGQSEALARNILEMAALPTPPQPITATESPLRTPPVFTAAPKPAMTPAAARRSRRSWTAVIPPRCFPLGPSSGLNRRICWPRPAVAST